MNKIKMNWTALFLALLLPMAGFAQDNMGKGTGLPGDGLSLEGVLEVFKKSESLEAFEQALNQEANYVNNLDLDEDGNTDFIKVTDYMDQEVHAIVLQVDVDATASQDVAVIEIEKTGKEVATLQIVGDKDVYGTETYVEPFEMEATLEGKGPATAISLTRVIVNVWAWPSVRFVYRPAYRPYVSPWRYNNYPVRWWKPWRVRPHSVCQVYRAKHYQPRFRVVKTHRVVQAHRVYAPKRKTTTVVRTRTTRVVGFNKNERAARQATNARVVKTNPNRATVVKKTTTTKVRKTNANNPKAIKKTTTTKAAKAGKKRVVTKKTVTRKKG